MNQGAPQPFYQGQPMQQPQPQPYQQPFYLPNPAQRFDEMSMAQNSQIPMRQPMPMYQQPQQPMQQAGTQPAQAQTQQLTGRYIGDYREILPKEVPMDGTVGFFPTNDMTRIYVKAWTPDGRVVASSSSQTLIKAKLQPKSLRRLIRKSTIDSIDLKS